MSASAAVGFPVAPGGLSKPKPILVPAHPALPKNWDAEPNGRIRPFGSYSRIDEGPGSQPATDQVHAALNIGCPLTSSVDLAAGSPQLPSVADGTAGRDEKTKTPEGQ